MTAPGVSPFAMPLTVEDARQVIAPTLLKLCSKHGPTRVALAIGGADDGTVRDARDEKSTLRLDYAANLLLLDGQAFEGFLLRAGRRSVPINAKCDSDVMLTTSAALHVIATARSPLSPGGVEETDDELLAQETDIELAMGTFGARLSRIAEIKLERAARAAS